MMSSELRESVRVLNQEEALKALIAWMVNVGKIIPRNVKAVDVYAYVLITADSEVSNNVVSNAKLYVTFTLNGHVYEGYADLIEASAYRFMHGSMVPLDIPSLIREYGNKIPITQNELWLFKVRVLERVGGYAEG